MLAFHDQHDSPYPLHAGLAVTSATVVIYGAPVVDPVALLGKMEGVVPICLSLFGKCTASNKAALGIE